MGYNADNNNRANGVPPTEAFEVTDRDLINLFVKNQITTWGEDQVEAWFNEGFNVKVVGAKVIWVK